MWDEDIGADQNITTHNSLQAKHHGQGFHVEIKWRTIVWSAPPQDVDPTRHSINDQWFSTRATRGLQTLQTRQLNHHRLGTAPTFANRVELVIERFLPARPLPPFCSSQSLPHIHGSARRFQCSPLPLKPDFRLCLSFLDLLRNPQPPPVTQCVKRHGAGGA